MLQRKLLATLLATALLLSAALPAFAAPAQEEAGPISIVSVVMSWLSQSFGLDIGSAPEAKLGSVVDPGGLEGNSEPGAKLGIVIDPDGLEGNAGPPNEDSSPTFSTTSNDEPGDELGIFIDPDG